MPLFKLVRSRITVVAFLLPDSVLLRVEAFALSGLLFAALPTSTGYRLLSWKFYFQLFDLCTAVCCFSTAAYLSGAALAIVIICCNAVGKITLTFSGIGRLRARRDALGSSRSV